MAIISFPYDSQLVDGVYDRAIKSATYRQLLSKYFTTGVFPNPSTQCQVYPSTGMKVSVRKGSANINGLYVELEEDVEATIEQADTQGRYDRIVLRHDDNNNVRATNVVVIKGTAGASPQAPSLTRNETVYDICLATVYVRAGATSISASDITDTRLNKDLCGIVSATIESIDTTTLYNQIQSDLLEFKTKEQADFEEFSNTQEQAFLDWFEGIKGILGEDEAGNLLNLIQENQANIEKLQYTGNIVSGETFIGKASNKGVKLHKVVGKTAQDGVPTPDSEVPIQNVVITEIYSNGEDGTNTDTKTNTVKTSITLADGDIFENGVITRKRKKVLFDGSSDENWERISELTDGGYRAYVQLDNDVTSKIVLRNPISNRYTDLKSSNLANLTIGKCIVASRTEWNGTQAHLTFDSSLNSIDLIKQWLQSNPVELEYDILTPTTEELKIQTVPSYYPNTNVWTDNTVSTDIEWEVLSEADNSLEIEEIEGNLQRPNLLINADFRNGVINQRGKNTYTENNKYSIDKWKLVSSNLCSLTISDGYITLSEGTNMIQYVDLDIGDDYIVSAYFNDELHTLTFKANTGSEAIASDYITTYYDSSNSRYVIGIRSGIEKIIKYIKLEKGFIFTGMRNQEEISDIFRCYKRYVSYKSGKLRMPCQIGSSQMYITYSLPIEMDGNPSIVLPESGKVIWQNTSGNQVTTTVTSATVIGKAGNLYTVEFAGSFGNSSWVSGTCIEALIAFDSETY